MYRLSSVCISDRTSEFMACFIFKKKNPTLQRIELYKMYGRYKITYVIGTYLYM